MILEAGSESLQRNFKMYFQESQTESHKMVMEEGHE